MKSAGLQKKALSSWDRRMGPLLMKPRPLAPRPSLLFSLHKTATPKSGPSKGKTLTAQLCCKRLGSKLGGVEIAAHRSVLSSSSRGYDEGSSHLSAGRFAEKSDDQSNRHLRNISADRCPHYGPGKTRRAASRHETHAAWWVHAGRHAPCLRERRHPRCEGGRRGAYGYAPCWPHEFAGAYQPHDNAAAAGSALGGARGGLAARVSSEAGGFERECRAGSRAASRSVLEREPPRFSLPQQGRAYFRRGQRDDGLG